MTLAWRARRSVAKLPDVVFTDIRFPVIWEGFIHGHSSAHFTRKHCIKMSIVIKLATLNSLSLIRQKSLGIRSPRRPTMTFNFGNRLEHNWAFRTAYYKLVCTHSKIPLTHSRVTWLDNSTANWYDAPRSHGECVSSEIGVRRWK